MSRSMIPSQPQLELLAEELGKNQFLVTGYARTAHARDRARATWQDVANSLNSQGNGCIKTWKQWAKYWKDKKAALKKKVCQIHRARQLTGGGAASTEMCLTAVEERFLALVGGDSFAIGDRELEINPFENPPNAPEREEPGLQTAAPDASPAFRLNINYDESAAQQDETHNSESIMQGFTFPAEAVSMVAEAGAAVMQPQRRPSRPMDSPLRTETMESTQHGTESGRGHRRLDITAASWWMWR